MKSGRKIAAVFGERLRAAMLARGHSSETSGSGVDVTALADAIHVSYEMARRYAEGLAMPRAEKLQAIASWLGVTPGGLAFDSRVETIDEGVLEQCMKAVIEAQQRTGKTPTTEQAAHLVAILYSEAVAGRLPAPASVDLLLRAT